MERARAAVVEYTAAISIHAISPSNFNTYAHTICIFVIFVIIFVIIIIIIIIFGTED